MNTLLKVNTELPVSARVRVFFKANTTVTTGAFGYVSKGTLANDTNLALNYAPTFSYARFKGGTEIAFTGLVVNGCTAVLSGTPAVNTDFAINHSPGYNNMPNAVLFRGGVPVILSGCIIANIQAIKTGTLANDTELYVSYTKRALFRAGTRVTFTGNIINNVNPVKV